MYDIDDIELSVVVIVGCFAVLFSNVQCVLSQCNTRLRLLHLLNMYMTMYIINNLKANDCNYIYQRFQHTNEAKWVILYCIDHLTRLYAAGVCSFKQKEL